MRMLKFPWLVHQEEGKKFEVYSVSVSPDGSRIASGGLDGKVRIWLVDTLRDYERQIEELESKGGNKAIGSKANTLAKKPAKPSDNSTETSWDPTFNIEIDNRVCRPLCSMARHTGAVTCVQFSPNGRFLASGSDDKILLIWEKDEETSRNMAANMEQRLAFASNGFGGSGSDGGIETTDLEHWVVRKRLVAHDNDIQDLAWSPDSSILVSVGLDRSIIVWSGSTFEKIKRFDIHQSHVKGVEFDPANKYFVTSSDDRTLRVFRYHRNSPTEITFSVESIVMDPFKRSPLTTYFRRCSWSPDGHHIAAPNAMNGHLSSVAIINRGTWDSDISLLGHELPCEVCSFSPRLYEVSNDNQKKYKREGNNQDVATVLATSGQDRILAIWNTSTATPLVVAFDICLKTITDMTWSPVGDILFISSLDGSITTVFFKDGELGKVIPIEENDSQLHRYGADRENMVFPESVDQLLLEEKAERSSLDDYVVSTKLDKLMKGGDEAKQTTAGQGSSSENSPFGSISIGIKNANTSSSGNIMPASSSLSTASKINVLTAASQKVTITKNGKKRVAPMLISATSSTSSSNANNSIIKSRSIPSSSDIKKRQDIVKNLLSSSSYKLPKYGLQTVVSSIRDSLVIEKEESEDKGLENQIDTIQEHVNNTKKSNSNRSYTRRKKEVDIPAFISEATVTPTTVYPDMRVQPSVIVEMSDFNDHMEIRNNDKNIANNNSMDFDEDNISSLRVFNSEKLEHKFDFFANEKFNNVKSSSFKVNDDSTVNYWCLTTENGGVYFLTKEGRAILPTIDLGVPISHLSTLNEYVLSLTRNGLLYVWNIKLRKNKLTQVSVAPILNQRSELKNEKAPVPITTSIIRCEVTTNGVPVVMLNTREVFVYDLSLCSWVSIIDPWVYDKLTTESLSAQGHNVTSKSKVLRSVFNRLLLDRDMNQNLPISSDDKDEMVSAAKAAFVNANDHINNLLS